MTQYPRMRIRSTLAEPRFARKGSVPERPGSCGPVFPAYQQVEAFLHRVPEELYGLESDPCELRNLIEDPKHKGAIEELRKALLGMMTKTNDPLLDAFKKRIGV